MLNGGAVVGIGTTGCGGFVGDGGGGCFYLFICGIVWERDRGLVLCERCN